MPVQIPVDQKRIVGFCRLHYIRRLALSGSVLRSDFGPNNDVDVFVEFEPDYVPGFAFFSLESELSDLFERHVDLNTPAFLSKYFRDDVLREARVLYD